jgi:aminoglycoside phosphotransferase (APT) family kinase protein
MLWDSESMRLVAVVDFETAAVTDAEYDFRYMPREYELFVACVARYQEIRGDALDLERVMAWHIRTSLGDALWRAEAGVAMPAGGTTPDEWFDLVENRLALLGVELV